MWPRGDHHAAVSSAQGGLPSYSVHKNDDFVALLTIHPINPGHVMVVPKAHVESCYGDPLRLGTLPSKRSADALDWGHCYAAGRIIG